jgi:hypothetical protein
MQHYIQSWSNTYRGVLPMSYSIHDYKRDVCLGHFIGKPGLELHFINRLVDAGIESKADWQWIHRRRCKLEFGPTIRQSLGIHHGGTIPEHKQSEYKFRIVVKDLLQELVTVSPCHQDTLTPKHKRTLTPKHQNTNARSPVVSVHEDTRTKKKEKS